MSPAFGGQCFPIILEHKIYILHVFFVFISMDRRGQKGSPPPPILLHKLLGVSKGGSTFPNLLLQPT